MSQNIDLMLEEHFSDFVTAQIQSGRYQSAGDVIKAGLRLLQAQQEAQKLALQNALIEGERSGAPESFDFDKFIARKQAQSPAE